MIELGAALGPSEPCARECLGTPVPPHIIGTLSTAGPAEPSARYLTGSRLRQMIEDFRALDRWTDRMGWAREVAFPPARYMRGKYPEAAVKWLLLLYLRRGLTRISRLMAFRNADTTH